VIDMGRKNRGKGKTLTDFSHLLNKVEKDSNDNEIKLRNKKED
jgi:hypothetical protein